MPGGQEVRKLMLQLWLDFVLGSTGPSHVFLLGHVPEEKTKDDNQKTCPDGGDQKAKNGPFGWPLG